jgi:magnesium transporter
VAYGDYMSEATSAPAGSRDGRLSGDGTALTCKVFQNGQPAGEPRHLADISEILRDKGCLVWLDVVDPGQGDLAMLQEEFDLHPLAVEDAIHAHQRPKIEPYGSYWFVVVLGTTMTPEGTTFHEMAIFAGKNFLVTVRHHPPYPLGEIEQRWQAHPEDLRHGAGFLLYTILDTVVDGYFPVAESFQERVDELEERLFTERRDQGDVLKEIFEMKKDGQQFRRAVLPMRDILNPIIRRDLALFPEGDSAYFRDVYDHSIRLIDGLDTVRDLVNSALDIHLSLVGNRHNEVARQLTIIATIFLPLSFLTGFFGQNFAYLVRHITGPATFFGAGIGLEALAVAALVWVFKKRNWF